MSEEARLREQICLLVSKKCTSLQQLADELMRFITLVRQDSDVYKKWLDDAGRTHIKAAHDALTKLNQWDAQTINQCLKDVAEQQGIKFMQLGNPLRMALIAWITHHHWLTFWQFCHRSGYSNNYPISYEARYSPVGRNESASIVMNPRSSSGPSGAPSTPIKESNVDRS